LFLTVIVALKGMRMLLNLKNRNYECYGYLAGLLTGGSVASFIGKLNITIM
jgi:hypothetical protein